MSRLAPAAWPKLDPHQLDRVVEGQVGFVEGGGRDGRSGNLTPYGKAYGLDAVAYCSIGVWWCFKQCGVDLRHLVTAQYASAEQAMEGWRRAGLEVFKNPRFMDVAFFHFPGEHAGANHTGFVVGADTGGVHTIEFNTSSGVRGSQVNGGGCYGRYRPYSLILGYGRYPFTVQLPVPKIKPVGPDRTFPTLVRGDGAAGAVDPKNAQVRRLQNLLRLKVTGVYDNGTNAAVRRFQNRKHLRVDGVAGPATLRALGY